MRTVLFATVALVVGASAAALHPLAALGLVLGIAVVAWVLSNPLNATLAFIAVLVLRPADFFPSLIVVQPAKIVGLVAILLWLVTKFLRGDMRLSRAPHGKWMLALGLAVLLASVMSTNRASSLAHFRDEFVKILIMYTLVVHLVDTKSQAVRLQLTLALSTVCLALYVLYQRTAGLAIIEGNRAAFVGLLGDPNDVALILLMPVPLFVELAMCARGARRLIWIFPLAVLIAGILVTVSRGGVLGLACALGAVFYDRGQTWMRPLFFSAGVACLLGLILLAGVNDRASGALNQSGMDESSKIRLDAWESGLRMAAYNPIFGVGFQQFADNYQRHAWDPVKWGPTEAHNSYIKVVAETGLVGFVPFMAVLILSFVSAYRLRKAEVPEDKPMEQAVRRSLFPAMTGFCVAAFFLSQCWGWFLFILFSQSAAMQEIWKPEQDASSGSVPAHDVSKRNGLALHPS